MPKTDPWAPYKGLGGELVAAIKHDWVESKCCGAIVLPGVGARLMLARLINEAVEREVTRRLRQASRRRSGTARRR